MSLDNKQIGEKLYAFETNSIMKAIRTLFLNIIGLSKDVNECTVGFGAWTNPSYSVGNTYQVLTDGFIVVEPTRDVNNTVDCYVYTDSSSNPTSLRGHAQDGNNASKEMCTVPVKAGDYVKFTQSSVYGTITITWIPLNKHY